MKLKLNNTEEKAFSDFANSSTGRIILKFLERLVEEHADFRTIEKKENVNTDLELEARKQAIKIIEENLIERIKLLIGEIAEQDQNEFV